MGSLPSDGYPTGLHFLVYSPRKGYLIIYFTDEGVSREEIINVAFVGENCHDWVSEDFSDCLQIKFWIFMFLVFR
jgi:hypothetical protein